MTSTQAVKLITALRDLTEKSGTITNRVQSKVLRSLSDEDLLRVAVMLKEPRSVAAASLYGTETSEGDNADVL